MLKIAKIFFCSIIIIFVTAFYDRFAIIEEFYFYLSIIFIIALFFLAVASQFDKDKGEDNDT